MFFVSHASSCEALWWVSVERDLSLLRLPPLSARWMWQSMDKATAGKAERQEAALASTEFAEASADGSWAAILRQERPASWTLGALGSARGRDQEGIPSRADPARVSWVTWSASFIQVCLLVCFCVLHVFFMQQCAQPFLWSIMPWDRSFYRT